jgi:hypothetical protein
VFDVIAGFLAVPLVLMILGCSRSLTHKEAEEIVRRHPALQPDDAVLVEAVSHESGQTEAIARAKLIAPTLNLKFRRYDTGWTWEFVETRAGGWIAPDVAIGQVRKEIRQANIAMDRTTPSRVPRHDRTDH